MNTSGFIRGMMLKNKTTDEFMEVVVRAIRLEFDLDVHLLDIGDAYLITMKEYKIGLGKQFVDIIKTHYGIDRLILEEFERQGFTFDRNRSQYIQYCFGNYSGKKQEE